MPIAPSACVATCLWTLCVLSAQVSDYGPSVWVSVSEWGVCLSRVKQTVCLASSCHGCPPSQEPSRPPLGSRAPGVPGAVSFSIAAFLHPSRRLREARTAWSMGPAHSPLPEQGRSRNAKRTSSGAGTDAASPPCGDATRMMTAPTTATRTSAVSGQQDWERTVGGALLSAHVAATAAGPPAWTLLSQIEAGKPPGRRLPPG